MTNSTAVAPRRRRPTAVIGIAATLVVTFVAGSAAYVVTENGHSTAALSAATSELRGATSDLEAERENLAARAARAAAPLAESDNRVLNDRARLGLAAAIQRSDETLAKLNDASGAVAKNTNPQTGFRWFWDDSAEVGSVTARTTEANRFVAEARDATSTISSAENAVEDAVTTWESEQVSTLVGNASAIEVKSIVGYDGTPAGFAAVQTLLDAGGHVALTYPGSTTPVVTAHNYLDPTALTSEPGDIIVLSGAVTGTYSVATVSNVEPWSMPATVSSPAAPAATAVPAEPARTPKAVALQALNWNGKLMRYLTLTPYTAPAA